MCTPRCYQSQNYKIWKQFTTILILNSPLLVLLSIAKLQNLKAIHNPLLLSTAIFFVVINRKTTKFESNSQPVWFDYGLYVCCYQSQNYKIWKQFTTKVAVVNQGYQLLSIAKLQNLKAIHNEYVYLSIHYAVVINRKTTKFESNSQQNHSYKPMLWCCYQSQNYKIWKQFTTKRSRSVYGRWLLSIAKLQNLKAIHNYTR